MAVKRKTVKSCTQNEYIRQLDNTVTLATMTRQLIVSLRASTDSKLQDIAQSLLHGLRLAVGLEQLLGDDGGQHAGCQGVEDADRPDGDLGVEHLGQQAWVEQRTDVTAAQVDNAQVLEGRE